MAMWPFQVASCPQKPFLSESCGVWRYTLEASVRMSFESFTRHCRGTVTSITFAFSLFLLLSLTNFPYQALTMMRPGDRVRQTACGGGAGRSPRSRPPALQLGAGGSVLL